ncbi:MAG: hypothetical protein JSV65_18835 [Armatimonadota bacterium]|nr:MAG: hypothetical protein JSV65_18835 [Armatimonadota bacterium]
MMKSNGKQTLAIVLSFAVMIFAVLGIMWSSLDGRMAGCEQQVAKEIGLSAAQRATVDLRLANIEKQVEEIRLDVKALREEGGMGNRGFK